jgi:hypothetical protein
MLDFHHMVVVDLRREELDEALPCFWGWMRTTWPEAIQELESSAQFLSAVADDQDSSMLSYSLRSFLTTEDGFSQSEVQSQFYKYPWR